MAVDQQEGRTMRRLFSLAVLGTSLTAVTAGPAGAVDSLLAPAAACPDSTSTAASVGEQKTAMRCLVDWVRRSARLPAVDPSTRLGRSAQGKVDLIARCGSVTHSPCGQPWNEVFADAGFRGSYFENLAAGGGRYGTARGAMSLWLASPGHRRALLADDVTVVGVGLRLHAQLAGARASVWALHLGRPS
jgi:uncharacterized protein YkwD